METKEVKKVIEVENVVLTPKAIKELQSMQQHDNEVLRMNMNIIADSVCFIGELYHRLDNPNEKREAVQKITDLSLVRDSFKNLFKPENM